MHAQNVICQSTGLADFKSAQSDGTAPGLLADRRNHSCLGHVPHSTSMMPRVLRDFGPLVCAHSSSTGAEISAFALSPCSEAGRAVWEVGSNLAGYVYSELSGIKRMALPACKWVEWILRSRTMQSNTRRVSCQRCSRAVTCNLVIRRFIEADFFERSVCGRPFLSLPVLIYLSLTLPTSHHLLSSGT
jgi:hypothetical protein